MNLRSIKKDIEYVLSAFIEDCSVFASLNSNADDKLEELVEEGIALYNDLKDKVNAKAEGSKKAYFNNLRKETLEKTDALYEKLSAIVKSASEEKPAEKKPAAKKAPAKKVEKAEGETVEKKPAAKKAPAKKAAEQKSETEKKPAAKKTAAKKPAAPEAE